MGTRDHAEKMRTWHSYLETVARRVSGHDFITTAIQEPTGLSNHSLHSLFLGPGETRHNRKRVADELAGGSPRIAVHSDHNEENGTTQLSLSQGRCSRATTRSWRPHLQCAFTETFGSKRHDAPSADISGRWDADILFYSSISQHTCLLNRTATGFRGSHKGDFSMRDMVGTIEGKNVN